MESEFIFDADIDIYLDTLMVTTDVNTILFLYLNSLRDSKIQ